MWFLEFLKDFIATPAILVGLFALIGSLLLRKKFSESLTTFFKTAAGFLIIGGGAALLVQPLDNFQILFEDLFNVRGTVPNNDALGGWFVNNISEISQLGSIIMVLSLIMNIIVARLSRFKYIYLSGHVLFYMSIMLASVLVMTNATVTTNPSGIVTIKDGLFDLSNAGDYTIALIASVSIMGVYMTISPAVTKKYVKQITDQDNLALAHTGNFGYAIAGFIGEQVHKFKKGKVRSTEDINFPQHLQIFRNTFISMTITMFIFFGIAYLPMGIMYELNNSSVSAEAAEILSKQNWLVSLLLDALIFAAGVEVLLMGVRMIIAELVPSFKGISDKVIPGAIASVDCPIVFPYAPNAVLIGFLSSLIAGFISMGITIGISQAPGVDVNLVAVILPGIIPHFFLGATSGVFGNVKGGVLGAVLGPFVHGMILSFVPMMFLGLKLSPNSSLNWGDTDYIIGMIPALLGLIGGTASKILIPLIPILAIIGLSIDGILLERKNKKPSIDKANTKDIKKVKQIKTIKNTLKH